LISSGGVALTLQDRQTDGRTDSLGDSYTTHEKLFDGGTKKSDRNLFQYRSESTMVLWYYIASVFLARG